MANKETRTTKCANSYGAGKREDRVKETQNNTHKK